MKREIKFRIWDGEKMWYPNEDNDLFLLIGDGGYFSIQDHSSEKFTNTPTINGYKDLSVTDTLTGNLELMQFNGFYARNNQPIYECDVAKFTPPADLNASFYNSNCGKIMIKNEIDTLLIRFNISEFLSLDYDIFFVKNGVPVTKQYWFEKCGDNYKGATRQMLKDLQEYYTQSDSDLNFIKYLNDKKGLEIIGNIYQNPELL